MSKSFMRLALVTLLLTAVMGFPGVLFASQPPESAPDEWAKEIAALGGLQTAIGAERIRRHKANSGVIEHSGQAKDRLANLSLRVFDPDDIEVRLYRAENAEGQAACRQSFNNPLKNLKGWQMASRNGYPSHEFDGDHVDQTDAIMWVLYPRHLLVVRCDVKTTLNERTLVGARKSRKRAAELVDMIHEGLTREGCIESGTPAALSLTFVTDGDIPVPVRDLVCTLSVNGKTQEFATNGGGYFKAPFEAPDKSKDLVVRLTEVTLTDKTAYGTTPADIVGRHTLPFEQKFTLSQRSNFATSETLKLPVRDVFVTLDVPTGVTRGALTVYRDTLLTGEKLMRVKPDDKRFKDNRLTLRVPALAPIAGTEAIFFGNGRDNNGRTYEGWEYISLAGVGEKSQAVIVELRPGTMAGQFESIKPVLRRSLQQSGFAEEEIDRILAVRIITPQGGRARYHANTNTIELPPETNVRTNSVNLGHELGHHITNIIANDNPPNVGGGHDVNDVLPPEGAWDEGRAHFYSWAFVRLARLPGEGPIVNTWTGVTTPDQRQLFVFSALTDHYGNRALYPTLQDALRDFRNVHQQAKTQNSLGRPPRTVAEFISVKQQTATGPMAQDLEVMAGRFGVGNP
jgi:hypothetical protein